MVNTDVLEVQPTIETDRLLLVQLGAEHFEEVWQSLQDPDKMTLTGTTQTFSSDQVHDFLGQLLGRNDRADFAVTRKDDGAVLGEAVLNDLDAENESMNYRIALNRNARNQGYGTEATRAVVGFGFDRVGLHRITLGEYAFNPRAQRVYENVGFVQEGRLRESLFWAGERHDEILMAILTHERA